MEYKARGKGRGEKLLLLERECPEAAVLICRFAPREKTSDVYASVRLLRYASSTVA